MGIEDVVVKVNPALTGLSDPWRLATLTRIVDGLAAEGLRVVSLEGFFRAEGRSGCDVNGGHERERTRVGNCKTYSVATRAMRRHRRCRPADIALTACKGMGASPMRPMPLPAERGASHPSGDFASQCSLRSGGSVASGICMTRLDSHIMPGSA